MSDDLVYGKGTACSCWGGGVSQGPHLGAGAASGVSAPPLSDPAHSAPTARGAPPEGASGNQNVGHQDKGKGQVRCFQTPETHKLSKSTSPTCEQRPAPWMGAESEGETRQPTSRQSVVIVC